jgi:hypothetical protein
MDWSRSEGKNTLPDLENLAFFSVVDGNDDMLDCFLNLPHQNEMSYPLELPWIQQNQFDDEQLNMRQQAHPNMFPVKYINNVPLVCYREDPAAPENEWKICIPTSLLQNMV